MVLANHASEFGAAYDRTSKIISAVLCGMLVVVSAATGNAWVLGASVLLVLFCFAFSPRGYQVLPDALRVRRLAGAVRIPRSVIRSARKAQGDDLAGAIRLWGNGGLFGYYGIFRTTGLGTCRWYVTNRSNAVVLLTDSRPVVISPDDPESFLEALAVPASSGGEPPAGSTRARNAIFLAVAALAILGIGVAAFAMLYAPGPPGYTLSRASLRIDDRFYPVTLPAGSVDLAGVRIVDLSSDPDWRPVDRTNGFANTHYQSGWFRVQGGQTVRLYRAGGTRLVLLPRANGAEPVLLQVDDAPGFMARLRQEWSG